MAYYKKQIFEKEKIISLHESEGEFCNKNKFKSEKELVKNIYPIIGSLIKNIYNEDVNSIIKERDLDLSEYGYFKVRCDLYLICKSKRIFVIEAKNPTHDKTENLNAIGQMIGYQLMLDAMPINYTLILLTPVFKFYLAEMIKRHDINTDIMLFNKRGTAGYLLKKYL